MTTQTTKVKNGTILLPKKLRQEWQDAQIIILPSKDGMYIKKLSRPSLLKLKSKLQKLGKLIRQKDIDEAIKWAKQKTY